MSQEVQEKPKSPYVQLQIRVLAEDCPLPPAARLVAIAIGSRFGKKDHSWPSIEDIIKKTGIKSRTTIRRALKILCDSPHAVFECTPGGSAPGGQRRPATYRFLQGQVPKRAANRVRKRPGHKLTRSSIGETGSIIDADRVNSCMHEQFNELVQEVVQQKTPDPLPLPSLANLADRRALNLTAARLARLWCELGGASEGFKRKRRVLRTDLEAGVLPEELRARIATEAQERARAVEHLEAAKERERIDLERHGRIWALGEAGADYVLAHPGIADHEAIAAWSRTCTAPEDELRSALCLIPYRVQRRQASRTKVRGEQLPKAMAYG